MRRPIQEIYAALIVSQERNDLIVTAQQGLKRLVPNGLTNRSVRPATRIFR
jgi:hypothetical protein